MSKPFVMVFAAVLPLTLSRAKPHVLLLKTTGEPIVPVLVESVGVAVVLSERLYPVGTFVVVARVWDPEINAPFCTGVISIFRFALEVSRDIEELPTSPKPVIASPPFDWRKRLPATKDNKKLNVKTPATANDRSVLLLINLGSPDVLFRKLFLNAILIFSNLIHI
ncbi:MAG: hypothetical protein ACK5MU_04760 [Candidatus Saccharimonadales bacterium]